MRLDGAVAVVTGGAFGIGRATAIELARSGAHVVVADVADDRGQAAAATIVDEGGNALYVHADVADRAEAEAMVAAALEWRGHCDLLISNAAISGYGPPHQFSPDDWERIIGVNLFGAIWATRAVLPHMLERDAGHLSFVSSGAGFQGIPDNAPYSVSKFALVGLAESLALFLKETAVSVSLVAPGAIGGEHADTIRVAGASTMTGEELDAVKAERRARTRSWPRPELMARLIIEGITAGRYYIIQEGNGYEDWLGRQMRARWADPEAFIKNATRR